MSTKKTLILNKEEIHQKSKRIAFQILEDNFDEESIVLAGIADRGYVFAQRLQKLIKELAPEKNIELIKVSINKNKRSLEVNTDVPVEIATDKAVIVVDDVLNSGRTIAYALGAFINVPLKKMRTAVLIDRSHHQFPVFSDFYGQKLSTVLKEHVEVYLEEIDNQEDSTWLS